MNAIERLRQSGDAGLIIGTSVWEQLDVPMSRDQAKEVGENVLKALEWAYFDVRHNPPKGANG